MSLISFAIIREKLCVCVADRHEALTTSGTYDSNQKCKNNFFLIVVNLFLLQKQNNKKVFVVSLQKKFETTSRFKLGLLCH